MSVNERLNPLLNQGYSDAVVTDDSLDDSGYRGAARRVLLGASDEVIGAVTVEPDSQIGTGGTGTTTGSAAAIGPTLACQSVLLQNTHATLTLMFGNSTAQPCTLSPGQFASIPATDVAQIFVIDGTGHATFGYIPVVEA